MCGIILQDMGVRAQKIGGIFKMTTVLGILIFVCALVLVIAVLLQSSKNHRMSGVISGGAETFFGKQKGKSMDSLLTKITAVVAILFALLVLGLYLVNAGQNSTSVDPGDVEISEEELQEVIDAHEHDEAEAESEAEAETPAEEAAE